MPSVSYDSDDIVVNKAWETAYDVIARYLALEISLQEPLEEIQKRLG